MQPVLPQNSGSPAVEMLSMPIGKPAISIRALLYLEATAPAHTQVTDQRPSQILFVTVSAAMPDSNIGIGL